MYEVPISERRHQHVSHVLVGSRVVGVMAADRREIMATVPLAEVTVAALRQCYPEAKVRNLKAPRVAPRPSRRRSLLGRVFGSSHEASH